MPLYDVHSNTLLQVSFYLQHEFPMRDHCQVDTALNVAQQSHFLRNNEKQELLITQNYSCLFLTKTSFQKYIWNQFSSI